MYNIIYIALENLRAHHHCHNIKDKQNSTIFESDMILSCSPKPSICLAPVQSTPASTSACVRPRMGGSDERSL